ncbi:MAG: acylphosphatase [Candidatus Levybacteria bacterium CG_4_10_14_0_8_um_filter_35_23]|nr:MAG: acylphosphatase [Candidatus Levybacteria bacterium CG_4_10_14_0_8_um_filter_35_23]
MICHLVISGFVQGVGYRQFTKKTSLGLDLKGWVKNIDEGRVEVLFSGSKESIKRAIKACRKGPFLARVKNIDIEWEDKNMDFTQHQTGAGFNNFEIVI